MSFRRLRPERGGALIAQTLCILVHPSGSLIWLRRLAADEYSLSRAGVTVLGTTEEYLSVDMRHRPEVSTRPGALQCVHRLVRRRRAVSSFRHRSVDRQMCAKLGFKRVLAVKQQAAARNGPNPIARESSNSRQWTSGGLPEGMRRRATSLTY